MSNKTGCQLQMRGMTSPWGCQILIFDRETKEKKNPEKYLKNFSRASHREFPSRCGLNMSNSSLQPVEQIFLHLLYHMFMKQALKHSKPQIYTRKTFVYNGYITMDFIEWKNNNALATPLHIMSRVEVTPTHHQYLL